MGGRVSGKRTAGKLLQFRYLHMAYGIGRLKGEVNKDVFRRGIYTREYSKMNS